MDTRLDNILKTMNFNVNDYIDELRTKYKEKLNGYIYIPTDKFNSMEIGGYVKYVDSKGNIKNGGILIDFANTNIHKNVNKYIFPDYVPDPIEYDKIKLLLKGRNNKMWHVSISNKYIFYKSHRTVNDKFRDLFLSYIK